MTRFRNAMKCWLAARLPFGWGNISKLALAYFFSNLYFYLPVGTLYLQAKDLSYVQINSLWGIIVGTMFLAEVPTGMLADRIGRKRAINLALFLQLLGEVMYIFAGSYPSFVLTSIVAGIGFAFSSGCVEAMVYDALRDKGREQEMSKAMGSIVASQRAANLVAFSLGGLIIGELTQARFVLGIVFTACAVGIGWLISLTVIESSESKRAAREDNSLHLVRDGLRLLAYNRRFLFLVLLALVTIPFRDYLGMYQSRLAVFGVSPFMLGLAQALAAGLSILAARNAHCLEAWLGHRWALLLSTALPGLLYFLAAAVMHPMLAWPAFCLLSGSMSLREPLLSAHLNRHIDSKNRATVLSLISMGQGLYVALLGLLIGRIADFSLTFALLLMGGIVFLGSLLFCPRSNPSSA